MYFLIQCFNGCEIYNTIWAKAQELDFTIKSKTFRNLYIIRLEISIRTIADIYSIFKCHFVDRINQCLIDTIVLNFIRYKELEKLREGVDPYVPHNEGIDMISQVYCKLDIACEA